MESAAITSRPRTTPSIGQRPQGTTAKAGAESAAKRVSTCRESERVNGQRQHTKSARFVTPFNF